MFVGMSWGTPGWQSHWSLNSPKWSTPCMLKLEIGQAPQIGDPQPLGKKNASTKRFVVTTCFWVPTVDWKCLKSVWPQGKGDHFEHGWKVHTKRLQHLEIWHFQKHLLKKKNQPARNHQKKHDKYTCQLVRINISQFHHKSTPKSQTNLRGLHLKTAILCSSAHIWTVQTHFLNWFHRLVCYSLALWHSFHGLEFKKHGTKNLESKRVLGA